jgi:Flp pilus assembly protein TadD
MLTQCPICSAPVKEQAMECACGELLTSWSTLRTQAEALRQRGLALAAKGDLVGALVSFMEAALTGPQDTASLLDAAKCLALLSRYEDADRMLTHVASKPALKPAAEAVAALIKERVRAEARAKDEPLPYAEVVE